MTLDVPTLIVVTAFIATLAGGLMLFTWLQNRAISALLWWGAAYLCGAAGTVLLGARGQIGDFWSINIAQAMLLSAGGLTWCGLRRFDGRSVSLWYALVGSAVWLIVSGFGAISHPLLVRATVASCLSFGYAMLGMHELWRSRHDGLLSRWLAIAAFGLQSLVFLARIPLVWTAELPPGGDILDMRWLPFGIFEALFFAFGSAFILLSMTKERAEARHRRAAVIDPLTGVPNRRGFADSAERVLDRCRADARPASLLLFDLDHFKQINDTFGHPVGDEMLIAFCRTAQRLLRPGDVFARLGGEEFGCVLPGTTPQAAFAIAERIRADFAALHRTFGGKMVRATVSIGIANAATEAGTGTELRSLLGVADKALYQAKAKGRNRVEGRRPPLTLVASDKPQAAATPLGAA